MGSFRRTLFGFRPSEVETAIEVRQNRIAILEVEVAGAAEMLENALADVSRAEAEQGELAAMVIEREREIRTLTEKLQEANDRHERQIGTLGSVASQLEEIQTQARGQATRIRMKALHEAVEVSRRAQELADATASAAVPSSVETPAARQAPAQATSANTNGAGLTNGSAVGDPRALYEGLVKLEIGPLGDFSQLVGIEDAISRLGAAEISVDRFSEGRAFLSMRLDRPVELLRELEERAPMEFRVRRTGDDNLILDVDEDHGPEQRAA